MTSISQHDLRSAAERRVRASGHASLDAFAAAPVTDDPCVCVVLSDFELGRFAADVLAYLRAVPRDALLAWYRNFTRTLFLVGDVRRVAKRHGFAYVSANGATAWTWPLPAAKTTGLRRLIKALRSAAPLDLPARLQLACGRGGEQTLQLSIDTRDLALEDYLIHLNHTLCESFIEGHLDRAAELVIVNRGELTHLPQNCLHQRVHREPRNPAALRLFACVHHAT
jgi:hypothetical protein